MERVDIQVAIAFGASVQPLTKTTPKVRRTVIKSAGLEIKPCKNSVNVTVILSSTFLMSLFIQSIT